MMTVHKTWCNTWKNLIIAVPCTHMHAEPIIPYKQQPLTHSKVHHTCIPDTPGMFSCRACRFTVSARPVPLPRQTERNEHDAWRHLLAHHATALLAHAAALLAHAALGVIVAALVCRAQSSFSVPTKDIHLQKMNHLASQANMQARWTDTLAEPGT